MGRFAPRSPYKTTMTGFVERFCLSPARANILRGFKRFRDELRLVGFTSGFQWVDGSFVENCEAVKGRPPSDVDVVSVLRRPAAHAAEAQWIEFVNAHGDTLLDQDHCKTEFFCDAYFIDLDIEPSFVTEQTAYWFGLFSHQRDTFRWKGMVQIDLLCDDDAAMHSLEEIEATW